MKSGRDQEDIISGEAYRFPDEQSWPHLTDPSTDERLRVPPFSTLQAASARAALERNGELREIRLTAGWGSEWPLWEGILGPRSPEDVGIDAELASRLRTWNETWLESAERALETDVDVADLLPDDWFSDGEALTREVAIEVWATCDVLPYFRRYRISG